MPPRKTPPRKTPPRKKAPAVAAVPPEPRPAPHPTPPPWEWAAEIHRQSFETGYDVSVQTYPMHLGILVREPLRVPVYQRGVVWDGARQASFCQAAMACRVAPPVTILAVNRQAYVLDGQQRLTALGVRLERSDGTVNLTSTGLDVRTGQWREISPRTMLPIEEIPKGSLYLAAEVARGNLMDVVRYERAMEARYKDEEYPPEVRDALRDRMALLNVQDWCRSLSIPVMQIEVRNTSPEAWANVLRVFRMLNTAGVPFDMEAFEASFMQGMAASAIW